MEDSENFSAEEENKDNLNIKETHNGVLNEREDSKELEECGNEWMDVLGSGALMLKV